MRKLDVVMLMRMGIIMMDHGRRMEAPEGR